MGPAKFGDYRSPGKIGAGTSARAFHFDEHESFPSMASRRRRRRVVLVIAPAVVIAALTGEGEPGLHDAPPGLVLARVV